MDIQRVWKQIQMQTLTLWGTALPVGAVVGIASLIFADGLQDTAGFVAGGHLSLALILPLMLLLTIWLSLDNELSLEEGHEPREVYDSMPELIVVSLAVGIAGAVGSVPFFLFPGLGFPTVFGGFNPGDFQQEVIEGIGLDNLLIITGTIMISSIVVGFLAWLFMEKDEADFQ